ncbi:MAG: hypothetical protein MZV70_05980 [Desulfobacterales bacterium]|nr:hypothetical protein [Desulfobacterales bacterium]
MKRATHILFLLFSVAAAAYIVVPRRGCTQHPIPEGRKTHARPEHRRGTPGRGGQPGAFSSRRGHGLPARSLRRQRDTPGRLCLQPGFRPGGRTGPGRPAHGRPPRELLRLVVADYLTGSRAWVRAWEGSTGVTKVQTLQILVKDVVETTYPTSSRWA